mmetsp:Transcript_3916/g.5920  ORF Transcript_3916/g.5920 Transcript_3916/m.5920 type:complete len:80 (+) Transcript_3916:347-586(+)
MDDFQKGQVVDQPRMNRLWTWEDSSKIVNFVTIHLELAKKYGLDLGVTNNAPYTKEELKTKENELTEYFLYEMRKPAAE